MIRIFIALSLVCLGLPAIAQEKMYHAISGRFRRLNSAITPDQIIYMRDSSAIYGTTRRLEKGWTLDTAFANNWLFKIRGSCQGDTVGGTVITDTTGWQMATRPYVVSYAEPRLPEADTALWLRGDRTWRPVPQSQWRSQGQDISYTPGRVSIGTVTPSESLNVGGNLKADTVKAQSVVVGMEGAILLAGGTTVMAGAQPIDTTLFVTFRDTLPTQGKIATRYDLALIATAPLAIDTTSCPQGHYHLTAQNRTLVYHSPRCREDTLFLPSASSSRGATFTVKKKSSCNSLALFCLLQGDRLQSAYSDDYSRSYLFEASTTGTIQVQSSGIYWEIIREEKYYHQ